MSAAPRIAMFGGAFDPPHNAHLALAAAAIDQLGLDKLYVVPTGHAWHKARTLSPAADRLAMARLAFGPLPRVTVDARELERPGPTFTIDTLGALRAENPGAVLHLIMGADQFGAFRQWHRWQEILDFAIICIAGRAHSMPLETQLDAYPGKSAQFRAIRLPQMPVSATQVRQLAASGAAGVAGIAGLVPDTVARYIAEHQLYRSP